MIKPDHVLRHMCNVLPLVTDRFSELVAVTDVRIESDLTLSLNTESAERFVVGRGYGLKDLKMNNQIVSCVSIGTDLWELETLKANYVTGFVRGTDPYMADIEGWGLCEVVQSKTRTIFTVKKQSATPASGHLLEGAGYGNSIVKCLSVSGSAVTFSLLDNYWYESDCVCDFALMSMNIVVVGTPERAVDVYSRINVNAQSRLWCFIVFGDRTTVSKPSEMAGIVIDGKGHLDVTNITVTTDFDLIVFWPRDKTQESARAQCNEAYADIYESLEACLFGYSNMTGYQLAPKSSGNVKSESLANYIHQYTYQARQERKNSVHGIKMDNIYWDVPIREVDARLFIDAGDPKQEMKININLDGES